MWKSKVKVLFASFGLIMMSAPTYGSEFELWTKDKSPQVREFLKIAADHLPQEMKVRISYPVQVSFKPLSPGEAFNAHCGTESGEASDRDKEGSLAGYIVRPLFRERIQEIVLNSAFLQEIERGPDASTRISCRHGSLYRFALATLLHELTHIYDFIDPLSVAEKAELENCSADPGYVSRLGMTCSELAHVKGRVSDHPTYRRIAQWMRAGRRSPDAYEQTDLNESFAVNVEFFLLDEEFACRRPAMFEFLTGHFGYDPFPNRKCQPDYGVFLQNSGKGASLDPARIYSVHLLLAGKGEALMSRWGHLMFRLVICAPERATVSSECLKDEAHHLVIGFRAASAEANYDYLKGLTGAYPSQIVVYTLSEIITEYPVTELRRLTSLPIHLDMSQKERFLRQVAELYWQYGGHYRFLTNNCATDGMRLLKTILPEDHPLQSENPLSPKGVFRAVLSSGLASLDDPEIQGFDSRRAMLEQSYRILLSYAKPSTMGLEEYLRKTNAIERRALFEEALRRSPEKTRKIAAAFYLLESMIQIQLSQASGESLDRVFSMPEFKAKFHEASQLSAGLHPRRMIRSNGLYGVPLSSERVSENERIQLWSVARNAYNELTNRALERMPEVMSIFESVEVNLRLFKRTMAAMP
jgi:hypothetical protein